MAWLDELVACAHEDLGDREREALWARGVSDEQMDLFKIGYLNQKLPNLDAPDFLNWCHQGEKLDDVFVLPLTNTLGHIKGLQFRHVERERGRYMDFMPTRDELVLFGLGPAMAEVWRTGAIWLVEGGFDLFPIQRTFPNTVATLTGRITRQMVTFLRRLVDEVWLAYDMDVTGRETCAKFVHFHGHEFRARVVDFPRVKKSNGDRIKDPSDLWEAWGEERFSGFLKSQQDPFTLGAM